MTYDLKAINRNIRIILSLIEQKSFVAYTATPYSVILQRSEDYQRTWKEMGCPLDFTVDDMRWIDANVREVQKL